MNLLSQCMLGGFLTHLDHIPLSSHPFFLLSSCPLPSPCFLASSLLSCCVFCFMWSQHLSSTCSPLSISVSWCVLLVLSSFSPSSKQMLSQQETIHQSPNISTTYAANTKTHTVAFVLMVKQKPASCPAELQTNQTEPE